MGVPFKDAAPINRGQRDRMPAHSNETCGLVASAMDCGCNVSLLSVGVAATTDGLGSMDAVDAHPVNPGRRGNRNPQ